MELKWLKVVYKRNTKIMSLHLLIDCKKSLAISEAFLFQSPIL